MQMLKILRKTGTTTASNSNRSTPDSFAEAYDVVDDLSSWEIVDPSPSEDEQDLYSLTDEEDDVINEDLTSEEVELVSELSGGVISVESLSVPQPQLTLTATFRYGDGDLEEEDDVEESVDDDDDDDVYDEDAFGLDDELVPWTLKDRFGKQRITKMGKRSGSRVNKSKRGPYFYNRPGCVYGKHGLGVQHCLI